MTVMNNFRKLYNDSQLTSSPPLCSHMARSMMLKDRPHFLEIALPDVRYAAQNENATNRTSGARDEALAKIEVHFSLTTHTSRERFL